MIGIKLGGHLHKKSLGDSLENERRFQEPENHLELKSGKSSEPNLYFLGSKYDFSRVYFPNLTGFGHWLYKYIYMYIHTNLQTYLHIHMNISMGSRPSCSTQKKQMFVCSSTKAPWHYSRLGLLCRDLGDIFNLSSHEMTSTTCSKQRRPWKYPRDSTKLDAVACCKASFGSKDSKKNKKTTTRITAFVVGNPGNSYKPSYATVTGSRGTTQLKFFHWVAITLLRVIPTMTCFFQPHWQHPSLCIYHGGYQPDRWGKPAVHPNKK